jgi:hypothetical protein
VARHKPAAAKTARARLLSLLPALTASLVGLSAPEARAAEHAGDGLAGGAATLAVQTEGEPAAAPVAPEPRPAAGAWEVAFTPYIWAAGSTGEIGIPRGLGQIEVDRNFSDVLGNLEFAFMGALELRNRRFVAMADIVYLNVGMEAEGIRDPQYFRGTVDAEVFLATAAAGYRIVDQGRMFVDLLAGGRIVSLGTELELEGPRTTRTADKSTSQVSPLIAARAAVPISDNLALGVYGDAGGFIASDIKWQILGTIQWDISRHWRLIAGYRYMDIHHDRADYEFDLSLSGPLLGVRYRF